MVVVKPLLMPADVERMIERGELDGDAFFELVDGEIIWLAPAYSYHGNICANLIGELAPFARSIGARLFDGQTGFMVGERRQQLRCPDVALVTKERLHILPDEGFATAAPDFAVEVLSREQYGEAYAKPKVAEYFAAGARLVWLVDPRNRTVRAYQPGRDTYELHSPDSEVTLDPIGPGFRAPVASFFP